MKTQGGVGQYGFVEWFRPQEYERTEQIVPEMEAAGVTHLRTHISWAEYLAEGGKDWFDWLIPRLAARFDVLPCIHYTPPSLSRTGRTSGAPVRLKDYADFVDLMLTRYGRHFSHVELWNEPNNLLDWDWREDQSFELFCEMVGGAAYWVEKRGWKAVLGGPSPFDPYWLNLIGERGVLGVVSAVGIHGFPGTWDSEEASWTGWETHLAEMRDILERYNPNAEAWITEAGYSTWKRDENEQVRRFLEALQAPADRVYWYSWRDVPHDVSVQEGFWFDARHYHLGVVDAAGAPKLLGRLLMDGGPARAAEIGALSMPSVAGRATPIVITGGAGFIGANLAESYLADGEDVVIVDNLSRGGVEENLSSLQEQFPAHVHACLADIRDARALDPVLKGAKAIFHLAAQTAVTTSQQAPVDDFEINARGTLNVLEAVRRHAPDAPIVFASTNKVYGALGDIDLIELEDRYLPSQRPVRSNGIGEARPLDFCTPYGCSKGVADQYVLDYAKTFGLATAVLRMSCIYGPRQFGSEDQGWVAHFLIQAMRGEPITIFGNGKQVRDVLHVDDAVAAYRRLAAATVAGKPRFYNLGGGVANAVSLHMVLAEIAGLIGHRPDVGWSDWRTGDQPYFVADTRALSRDTGWTAKIGWRDGLAQLADWLREHRIGEPRPALARARA